MKKIISFLLLNALLMQPIMAQEQATPSAQASPSTWLSWFKSLRVPTMQDLQKARSYVNSKYRCLRHGENCTKTERAVLGTLVALVTAAIVAGTTVVAI